MAQLRLLLKISMKKPDQFVLGWLNRGKVDGCIEQLAAQEGDTVEALQRLWAYITDSKDPHRTMKYVINKAIEDLDNSRRDIFFANILRALENPENVPCLADPIKKEQAWNLAYLFYYEVNTGHYMDWFKQHVGVKMREIQTAIYNTAFEETTWEVPAVITSDLDMWSLAELEAFKELLFKLREIRSHGCYRFPNVADYLKRSKLHKRRHPLHKHLNIIVGDFEEETIQRGSWTDDGRTIAGLDVAELGVMIDYVKSLIGGRT
jgi:hypothetical protein